MGLFERKPVQRAAVVLLSLWIAASAFLFTRNQGIVVRILSAAACFAFPCAGGIRFLDGRPLPGKRFRTLCACLLAAASACWILLSLNNTSIGIWREELAGTPSAPLWGYARIVRGDEWAVWTPFLWSQDAENYPALNTAITAGSLDTTMIPIGGLPAWTPAAVFKPLYWGFLLLGAERGYSVLCLLRFVLLFAVSYRCALRYTGGSRLWSFTAALLITLSPYVQWWFSQSIAEVLIFSQEAALCWIRALETEKGKARFGFSLLSAWCFGCFIMILYPAWLIPVGFLMLAVMLRETVIRRKTLRFTAFAQMLVPFFLAGGLLALIAVRSGDTLARILRSVYPGQRAYTGGSVPENLFSGLYPLSFAVKGPDASNASELSNFLSFAPAGLVLAIGRFFRKKKADPFSVILAVFIAVFTLFALIPLPEWLARATLLYQCTRPAFIVSLCSLLLLIRTLSLRDEEGTEFLKERTGRIAALGCAVLTTAVTWFGLHPPVYVAAGLFAIAAGIFLLLFSRSGRRFTALVLCLLAVAGGAFVNPVQQGISEVAELPPVSLVRSLSPGQDTVLAVEADWPVPNALLYSGARVVNSTQPYADPDKWAAVDPERKWDDVYNRFCHVSLRVADETSFSLLSTDHMLAELTREDLKTLGVNWLVTGKEYAEGELLGADRGWYVYRLQ